MKRALIAGLVLVAAVSTGCGGTAGAGDTGAGATPTADAVLPKFCALLTAEQITEVVGAPVTLTTGPFDACEFDQSDPRALSGSLGVVELGTDNGGFESYRSGSRSSFDAGVEHPVAGLGEGAFVATGTVAGGQNTQAAGGVLVDGGRVYTVNLAQATGLGEDDLVSITTGLLKLLVDAG